MPILYSLDTSAILDGWVRHYPKSSFPGLWDKLADAIEDGRIRATEEVEKELEKVDDDCLAWCKSQSNLFLKIDTQIQEKVIDILTTHPNLVEISSGRSAADPFVIALAELNSCTVITGEISKPSKPRIPDVCIARSVNWGNLLYLIKQEKWTF